MKVLELFKGTGSVGKTINILYPGAEIVSLDILKKYEPTICGDIMKFDYTIYKEGEFDIIWASPECKVFSKLQHTNIGETRKWKTKDDLVQARKDNEKYVLKVLEIIERLKPKWWFIENPWDSAMKDIPQMKAIPSIQFDYCRYGFIYKKPTRIWTNRTDLVECKCNCEGTHEFRIGIISKNMLLKNQKVDETRTNQRYSIPPDLLKYLFS